jgi:glutamyl-tRNA synthetase
MSIITRFAPSPTGFLHIGGARTALFNWLYTKHCGGKFLLRIEDTDRARSTEAATMAIIEGLQWLGLSWDDDITYQYTRKDRHAEVAYQLLEAGKAYRCYSTSEEVEAFRAANPGEKFRSPWRPDEGLGHTPILLRKLASDISEAFVIRLLAPQTGETQIVDAVQGEVRVQNDQLDDMVLLRSDGTPTYMLAVVVDDHDMGVNFVIRGDDHLTNTFRQLQIFRAMGWPEPRFAHLPLIHGADGAKLSKRHGALGIEEYRKLGYLPEALLNYLLRLGFSGGEEIISLDEAVKIFDIAKVGRSPARFDFAKLDKINAHYIQHMQNNEELLRLLLPFLEDGLQTSSPGTLMKILQGMGLLKGRASSTLVKMAEDAKIFIRKQTDIDEKSRQALSEVSPELIAKLYHLLAGVSPWDLDTLTTECKKFAEIEGVKFPKIMQTLRAIILGTFQAPSIMEVMIILGQEETLARYTLSRVT